MPRMATIKGSSLGDRCPLALEEVCVEGRCVGQLQVGAKHLYLGPQLTSRTQNSNLQVMELEGATASQMEKLRSGIWS